MENTCNFENCTFGKSMFNKAEQCFNYKETWWNIPEEQPVLIKDCAPIRTLIMLQELSNRLIGVEKSQEQLRNECVWTQVVAEVIGRNIGIDLSKFVEERSRLLRIKDTESLKQIEG